MLFGERVRYSVFDKYGLNIVDAGDLKETHLFLVLFEGQKERKTLGTN